LPSVPYYSETSAAAAAIFWDNLAIIEEGNREGMTNHELFLKAFFRRDWSYFCSIDGTLMFLGSF
jgi:hypothetical protein